MKPKTPGKPLSIPYQQAFDEADWVDWDHWQAVEEIQNFRDGLATPAAIAEAPDSTDDNGHVARQIRRYGLQAGK